MTYDARYHIFPEQCAKFLQKKFRMHSELTVRELMVILKHMHIKTHKVSTDRGIYDIFSRKDINGILDFEFLNNLYQYRRDKQIRDEWNKEAPETYEPELSIMQNASDDLLRKLEVYYTNESKIKYKIMNNNNEIYHDLKESKIEDILKKYRISKKYSKNKDGYKTIEYSFGMNGKGLTKELCIIAKDVEKETKKPFYLCEAHFDILDDLYSFIVVTLDKYVNEHLSITEIKSYIKDINETIGAFNDVRKALNEGAWGYKPHQSDDFLDETHVIADKVIDILIEGLTKDKHHFYTYMGLTIDFLRTRYIASESFFWTDDEKEEKELRKKSHYKKIYKLIDSFNKAYEELKNSDNFDGWRHFDEFKKELDNTKKIFDKLMAERKMYSSDVDNDKLYELNKKRDKLFYEVE